MMKEPLQKILTSLQASGDELRVAVGQRHYIFSASSMMYDLLLKAETAIIDAKREANRLYKLEHPKRVYDIDSLTGHTFTMGEWEQAVRRGTICELDGIGYWCRDGKESRDEVFETEAEDATEVAWYGHNVR